MTSRKAGQLKHNSSFNTWKAGLEDSSSRLLTLSNLGYYEHEAGCLLRLTYSRCRGMPCPIPKDQYLR